MKAIRESGWLFLFLAKDSSPKSSDQIRDLGNSIPLQRGTKNLKSSRSNLLYAERI